MSSYLKNSNLIQTCLGVGVVGFTVFVPILDVEAISSRVTYESAVCEFLSKTSGEYIRDEHCVVGLYHTPIIVTAVDIYWSDGVTTRASMNITDIDFVGVLETQATIDGVAGRYITTGLDETNCFEITSNRNKICFSVQN